MSHRTCWRAGAALLALASVAALEVPRGAGAPSTISFDVPGKADATPWVAASGGFVAVVWGTSRDARADVFLAVSRDGGLTFGSPVRVNATAGEARLGGDSLRAWP